ncbi:MAG: carbon-nitrogen hydrolase family protein [Alphaproteobacteria bacterium]
MSRFRAALLQMNAAATPAANIAALRDMVPAARAAGADLICTPENTGMLEPDEAAKIAKAKPEERHEVLAACRELARETGAWLAVGSLAVLHEDGRRIWNRSYLLAPDGGIAARYDKIHLFDVELDVSYRESRTVAPGGAAVWADTPWARLGLTVCYDLRFPHLYRDLARAGAGVLLIPSAFTVPTGEAHWEVLLRARAVECGAYVLAAAQTGEHARGRRTWGHSLAVDPWGRVIASLGSETGILTVDIDTAEVDAARRRLPSLDHDRPYTPPAKGKAAAE